MNNLNGNDKDLINVLSYGVMEAPKDLELLVKQKIADEAVPTKRNYMGILAGWIPAIISFVGISVSILTSVIMFFPHFSYILDMLERVQHFIFSPTVMAVALSVLALILIDSFLQKRVGKTGVKLG
ncbi:MAG: hypothetical protein AB7S48_11745 [Bacteroidales bacterium]